MEKGQVSIPVDDAKLVALLIEANPAHLGEGSPGPGLGDGLVVFPLTEHDRPILAPDQICGGGGTLDDKCVWEGFGGAVCSYQWVGSS